LNYFAVLRSNVPINLCHRTSCSIGLCQLNYFTVLRAQMGCDICDILLLM